ncbi:DUF2867 domain-containing protein [Nocardioides pacificus]
MGLHTSRRTSRLAVSPDDAWRVVASGETGEQWYVDAAPLVLRGAIDRVLGGHGRAWPPPGRALLAVGDRAGFWEVTDMSDRAGDHTLQLVARVRAPGRVTLTTRVLPHPRGGTTLHQAVRFDPSGLVGRAYLAADIPAREALLTLVHRRVRDAARRG